MKKALAFCIFFLPALLIQAQNPVYNRIMNLIHEQYPETETAGKLLAITVWQAGDKESREANKAFDKTMRVYEVAKLKGGTKGFLAVALNFTDSQGETMVTLNKDGNTKLLSLLISDKDALPAHNAVFDSKGNELYWDLETSQVFNTIHQLISR